MVDKSHSTCGQGCSCFTVTELAMVFFSFEVTTVSVPTQTCDFASTLDCDIVVDSNHVGFLAVNNSISLVPGTIGKPMDPLGLNRGPPAAARRRLGTLSLSTVLLSSTHHCQFWATSPHQSESQIRSGQSWIRHECKLQDLGTLPCVWLALNSQARIDGVGMKDRCWNRGQMTRRRWARDVEHGETR